MTGIWYVVGYAFAGVSFVFLTIGLAWLISHRVRGDQHKGYPYESGIDTYGDTHARFGISFYIYALMFVAFDIEVIFIFLWALIFATTPAATRAAVPLDADLRRHPAVRPGLRVAQGSPLMAVTRGKTPQVGAPTSPASRPRPSSRRRAAT